VCFELHAITLLSYAMFTFCLALIIGLVDIQLDAADGMDFCDVLFKVFT